MAGKMQESRLMLAGANIGRSSRRYVHSDFTVVARRRKHRWECRVPGDSVDAAGAVAFEALEELAGVAVPDVDFGVCHEKIG